MSNKSTFRNECDIGKAESDWTDNYNTNIEIQQIETVYIMNSSICSHNY